MQQDRTNLVLLSTAPDLPTANRLAEGLVTQKLAACVNVLPAMTSYYVWQNKLHTESEHQLIIKTQRAHVKTIEVFFTEQHPYDVPEMLALPIDSGSEQYLKWLNDCLA